MRADAFGFCGRELERTVEHRAGPVVGGEVGGAVGVLQFQVVGVVVGPCRISGRMLGSSAPARTRVGVLSRLVL